MKQAVDEALAMDGAVFCEIFTDTKQVWEPKSSTKRLADGTLVSRRWRIWLRFCRGKSSKSRCSFRWWIDCEVLMSCEIILWLSGVAVVQRIAIEKGVQ